MKKIKIYTDGSCNPNPGKGGWAFALSKEEFKTGVVENTTNNIMEMVAIVEAIAYAKHEFPNHDIEIYSDSQYCVKGFTTWMYGWESKGWKKKGGEIKNLDVWKTLWEIKEDVSLIWVKGHEGNEMNEFVDVLASGGDPTKEDYIRTDVIADEWIQIFKEYRSWTRGGYKSEDRDAFLRRLQEGYRIEKI